MNIGDSIAVAGYEFKIFSIVTNKRFYGDFPTTTVILVRAHEGGYSEYYSLPLDVVERISNGSTISKN